jgi:hypothetical protein
VTKNRSPLQSVRDGGVGGAVAAGVIGTEIETETEIGTETETEIEIATRADAVTAVVARSVDGRARPAPTSRGSASRPQFATWFARAKW